MIKQFFCFFVPGDLELRPLSLTFELGRDFCTMYLTAKFDHLMFSHLELIMQTNKQTNKHTGKHTDKQTDIAEKKPSHFTMLYRWVIMLGIMTTRQICLHDITEGRRKGKATWSWKRTECTWWKTELTTYMEVKWEAKNRAGFRVMLHSIGL